jgi:hypothetical protein
MLLADRGYEADWIRALVKRQGARANIPPRHANRAPTGAAGRSSRQTAKPGDKGSKKKVTELQRTSWNQVMETWVETF